MNRSIQFIIYEDVEGEEIDPVEQPNLCLLLSLSSFLLPGFVIFKFINTSTWADSREWEKWNNILHKLF